MSYIDYTGPKNIDYTGGGTYDINGNFVPTGTTPTNTTIGGQSPPVPVNTPDYTGPNVDYTGATPGGVVGGDTNQPVFDTGAGVSSSDLGYPEQTSLLDQVLDTSELGSDSPFNQQIGPQPQTPEEYNQSLIDNYNQQFIGQQVIDSQENVGDEMMEEIQDGEMPAKYDDLLKSDYKGDLQSSYDDMVGQYDGTTTAESTGVDLGSEEELEYANLQNLGFKDNNPLSPSNITPFPERLGTPINEAGPSSILDIVAATTDDDLSKRKKRNIINPLLEGEFTDEARAEKGWFGRQWQEGGGLGGHLDSLARSHFGDYTGSGGEVAEEATGQPGTGTMSMPNYGGFQMQPREYSFADVTGSSGSYDPLSQGLAGFYGGGR